MLSQTLSDGRAGNHKQVVNRVKCHLCSFEPPFNVYNRPPTQTEENWRSMGVNNLCTNPIPLDVSVRSVCETFIRRHRWDSCHSTMTTKRRHQKCCAVQGCGNVSHIPIAILQMRKFSKVKYSVGNIFKGLNFCGSGHPLILNPLKLKGKKWNGRKQRGKYMVPESTPCTRRYEKLQLVKWSLM